MSKAKQKGTVAETAVVRYLQDKGIQARRNPLTGSRDEGDILISGNYPVTLEVKNHRTLDLATWVDQSIVERYHAQTRFGAVVHKRLRKGDPGDWFVTLPLSEFTGILKELEYGSIDV
jgi:Holliday junction resolvase